MVYAQAVRDGAIGTVILGDGSKGNAVGLDDLPSIHAALSDLTNDDAVRVIILRGGGEKFVTGARIGEVRDAAPDAFNACAEPIRQLIGQIGKPIIAAINGACIGLGVEIALWADIRCCSPGATFSIRSAPLGRVLGDIPLERLCAAIGPNAARYMVLSAGDISAEAALRQGLVHEIAEDPFERVQTLAGHISAYAPGPLAESKARLRALDTNPIDQLAG